MDFHQLYPIQISMCLVQIPDSFSAIPRARKVMSDFIPNAPVTSGFSAITVLDDGRLVGGSAHGISYL